MATLLSKSALIPDEPYFLCYYIGFEIFAFEKRLGLKLETQSCKPCMQATIPWLPYNFNY